MNASLNPTGSYKESASYRKLHDYGYKITVSSTDKSCTVRVVDESYDVTGIIEPPEHPGEQYESFWIYQQIEPGAERELIEDMPDINPQTVDEAIVDFLINFLNHY